MKPPCMACVVRDNPHGKAPPDYAYLVGLHDETRLPGAVRDGLCEAHKGEYAEIVAMYAIASAAAQNGGAA